MSGVAVRASKNSNCEAPVAAIMRALPLSEIALRIMPAASAAAARAREALSLNTLMFMGPCRPISTRPNAIASFSHLVPITPAIFENCRALQLDTSEAAVLAKKEAAEKPYAARFDTSTRPRNNRQSEYWHDRARWWR